MSNRSPATTIDEYIAEFPEETQKPLREMRALIREVAPAATETISYAIPTFVLNGNLVHFAGYQHHVGFYPAPSGMTAFESELSRYKRAKGSVQFPLSEPLPADLIRRMVAFRVQEQMARAKPRAARMPDESGFPPGLASPARRALAAAGYERLEQLAGVRESELAGLHGMGPKALGQLREALAARGLTFAAEA